MSTIERDFDRLALLDDDGWTHNNHYHSLLLRHVPANCSQVLEIGCGTGAFSRRLAAAAGQVVAIDLSPQMVRVARSRSANLRNIEYHCADVMSCDLRAAQFDCVTTIATLHHLPLRKVLLKLKETLKPGGVLIVLDLFEPERNLLKPAGWRDAALSAFALGISVSLRLLHNGRLNPPREVRAAWEEHGKTDSYPTMPEVRSLCANILPGAKVRQHLLWRYSLIWQKAE
jgi:ubiquinone/menaquinone biosynthesis C-methylase UbiE